jgi:heme-binding protein
MKTVSPTMRRKLIAGLLAPTAAAGFAVLAGPPATGANDPCAASEVARTIGSVSKSMGDYLDAHPETNQTMTTVLQQQAGPQSVTTLKSYFESNPKVAGDMTTIAGPLTNLSTQCKLPISIPQAMGLLQQAQGATGGLPGGVPALPPNAGALPLGGPATPPAATGPVTPVGGGPSVSKNR